ncbi:MAG: folate family ECF transporter S component [Lachnospiraceae bacterium]|nr:folate family ECF transporter S component [Ruminococcus sp.]MCM1274903.1 folate family ECF transporter S component [Lachnospiraceae bacterium]
MAFFADFKKSAAELKSVRCLCVTAVLIALDLALKFLVTINLPFAKLSVAFLALAAIGMLYGPAVAFLAGGITDILGMLIARNMDAFNPLFTLVEMTGGLIYGIFLYNFKVIKPDFSGGRAFFGSIGSNWGSFLRIVLAKLTVIVVCNLLMNTAFQVVTGYIAPDVFWVKLWARVGTNFIKMPFDVILLLLTMYPIKAAYTRVFKGKKPPKLGVDINIG